MIATFIMQSVAFILHHHKFMQRSFSLALNDLTLLEAIIITLFAPMATYLKDLTQIVGRYGGLSNKIGFKGFGCTSSIST